MTSYGASGSPTWGEATQVGEDSGGINRTTLTSGYTAWGKPNLVQDAAGHKFSTVFDLDGNVQTVTRTDVSPNVTVASYAYGTTAGTISFGQPTSITDGLSGVVDSITYDGTVGDGGIGRPSQTQETNGSSTYSVNYTYDSLGDRTTTQYVTPNGTENWGYYDYVRVGSPESGKRAFQTVNKLNSNLSRSTEELHYEFDTAGALNAAAFAQTPQTGQTGYTKGEPAQERCLAFYNHDPSGRILSATHNWETWTGSGYSNTPILDNECAYETTGLMRGLKTTSTLYSGSGANWVQNSQETYGYDPSLGS